MNEDDFWNTLRNKWQVLHWVRIENSAACGTPDGNFCYRGHDVWVELKILREMFVYLETFQMQFHISRNMRGGKSLIFARDSKRFVVLRLDDPKMLDFAISVGKFKKFNIMYFNKLIEWEKPFNWPKMLEELLEVLDCLKTS